MTSDHSDLFLQLHRWHTMPLTVLSKMKIPEGGAGDPASLFNIPQYPHATNVCTLLLWPQSRLLDSLRLIYLTR